MSLAVRSRAAERMDDVALDQATYSALIADLEAANRVTLAARPTLRFVARAAARSRTPRILDVGYGGGGTLRAVAGWCAAAGVEAELVGVDLNPRSRVAALAGAAPALPIDWRVGDHADQAGPWDVVLSSLVAHHMTEGELVGFLRWMEATARVGWFVNDLRRSALAQAGFRALATLARWHPIVRHDGALSVARSWTEGDWRVLLDAAGLGAVPVEVERWLPFRLCVGRVRSVPLPKTTPLPFREGLGVGGEAQPSPPMGQP